MAVAFLIPELVERRWWRFLLHTHRARRLRTKLLRYGEGRVWSSTFPGRSMHRPDEKGMHGPRSGPADAAPSDVQRRLRSLVSRACSLWHPP
ncbi:hypothetical protein [Variovorax sp. RCC_210]|uniref:hypothetical protein n=1 Tax=Variovorax sp. RCC_210 TaxID=3239217 RepID=UPI0010485D24